MDGHQRAHRGLNFCEQRSLSSTVIFAIGGYNAATLNLLIQIHTGIRFSFGAGV